MKIAAHSRILLMALFGGLLQGAISITPTSLPPAILGTAYSTTVSASGATAPLQWSLITGAPPPGLIFGAQGGAASVSGTPTLAGTFRFSVLVKDGAGLQTSAELTLEVYPAPAETLTLPQAIVAQPYSGGRGSLGTAVVAVISGSLPDGLGVGCFESHASLCENFDAVQVHGTPTRAGTWVFTLLVNSLLSPGSPNSSTLGTTRRVVQATITVQPLPPLLTLPSAIVGQPYSGGRGSLGRGTAAIISGTLPDGLDFRCFGGMPACDLPGYAGENNALEGTPTRAGTWVFTLLVNSIPLSSRSFSQYVVHATITVQPPPTMSADVPTVGFYDVGGQTMLSQQVRLTLNGLPSGIVNGQAVASTQSGRPWLRVRSPNFSNVLDVSVDSTDLLPGVHNGTITITTICASNSPFTIPVTFMLDRMPTMQLSPTGLRFAYATGGSPPAAQLLNISSGGTHFTYSAAVSSVVLHK
jgi:hypothetical protein